MKQLKVFRSMGTKLGVGWMRDDVHAIHVFAMAAPGELFQPSDGHGGPHWPCGVCDEHSFTETDFHNQILDALERGPES
jgi:hypothetical protein